MNKETSLILNQDIDYQQSKFKKCTVCDGSGALEDFSMEFNCCGESNPNSGCCGKEELFPVKIWVKCFNCNGTGDIEIIEK